MQNKKAVLLFAIILSLYCPKASAQSDSSIIVQHLKTITKTEGYRNYKNIALLNKTAEYILSVFRQYADTACYQPYRVNGTIYKNVVCRIGSNNNKPLVVVGAHYDVCGNQEGADDKAKSQSYPVKVMKVAYGTQGNFILLARKTGAGEFVKKFTAGFKEVATIETESLKAPAKIQGIDFSDHLNYWKFGYDALMITNTAFYRNRNYHHASDKMETLDIPKMMKVIDTTFSTIINL